MILDIILCAIIFICALSGLRRGFIYTLIHTLGWFISIAVAFVGTSHAKEFLFEDFNFLMALLPEQTSIPPYIMAFTGNILEVTTSLLSSIIIFVVIFLITKLILALLLNLLTKNDRTSFAGKINSFFGMVVGFLKGFIAVSILLFALLPFAQLVSPEFLSQCQNQLDMSTVAKPLYENNILPLIIQGFIN